MTAGSPARPKPRSAPRGAARPSRPVRESRQRILSAIRQAAIEEFSLHGLKGTSTQAIAERAGLTKPQLHYYIEGKEALYNELLHSLMMAWKIEFAPPGLTEPADILAHYVRQKLDNAFDQPAVSRIFTREILDGGHNLGRYWANTRTWIQGEVAIINGWIARGLMRPMNAHLLLMHIWALTQHHADYALQVQEVCGHPVDREAVANELIPFVLHGCGLK